MNNRVKKHIVPLLGQSDHVIDIAYKMVVILNPTFDEEINARRAEKMIKALKKVFKYVIRYKRKCQNGSSVWNEYCIVASKHHF